LGFQYFSSRQGIDQGGGESTAITPDKKGRNIHGGGDYGA